MKSITFDNITKKYGDTTVIENLDLKVNKGERLVLLGPSGCGKSTLLRIIAGFEQISSGELYFDDKLMNDIKPADRDVAMVFQNYALYPHMTVRQNITYALEDKKLPKEEINKRLVNIITPLNLEPYLDRKPAELSGGQRQRVALARATVKNSPIFLLDEPLSNLDAKLRVTARESLQYIHEQYKPTMVYVTHDQTEAMAFATRIVLLNKGDIQQIDTPENIYYRPNNIFTADFIGSPSMNIIRSSYYENGMFHIGNQTLSISDHWVKYINNSVTSSKLIMGVRPESCKIHKNEVDNSIKGRVEYIENTGGSFSTYIDIEGESICVQSQFKETNTNDTVYITVNDNQISIFDHDSEQNIGYPNYINKELDRLSMTNAHNFT